MKRLHILLFMTALSVLTAASAQDGLNINSVFGDTYRNDTGAVETIITGEALSDYELTLYHGLTLTRHADEAKHIERLVIKDGTSAIDKEVSYKDGHLYFGFYALPPVNNQRRYIFYLNNYLKGGDKLILIYLQGQANTDSIRKLLKRK